MYLSSRAALLGLAVLAGCTAEPEGPDGTTKQVAAMPGLDTRAAGGTDGGSADAGTGDAGPGTRGLYRLRLQSFSGFNDQLVRLKVTDVATPFAGVRVAGTVSSGALTLEVPDVLEPGHSYDIDYFVDQNRDTACSPCGPLGGEAAWRRRVTGALPLLDETTAPSPSYTDISPF